MESKTDFSSEQVLHDGKITLLNGTVINAHIVNDCPDVTSDNCLRLDETGQYFVIGHGKKPMPIAVTNDEEQTFFLKNAFFFIAHRREILSDSRMFLSPVPVQSGLAYTGTSGFSHPTLGIYLEWWGSCANSIKMEGDGIPTFIYQMSGSPLTGSNSCGIVFQDGSTAGYSASRFSSVWHPFMEINRRYDECKCKCESMTLRDVYKRLGGAADSKDNDTTIAWLYAYQTKMRDKDERNKILKKEISELKEKLKLSIFDKYHDTLESLYNDYIKVENENTIELKECARQKQESKKQLRAGDIDNKQYQKTVTKLKRRMSDLEFEINDFGRETIYKLFPDDNFTIADVCDYITGIKGVKGV